MPKLLKVVISCLGLALGFQTQAQTLLESFTGTTVSGNWTFSGNNFTPYLTAPSIDTAGNGWLRLTDTQTSLATYAVNNTAFNSANATIYASFDYLSWGGTGADGITFFLFDGSKTFSPGAYGGSLGYAQRDGVQGMNGGYLAIGLDEFGNFSNPTEGRSGGTGFVSDSISVRGPQNSADSTRMTGYAYLGGSDTLSQGIDVANSNGLTVRPSVSGANYRHVELTLTPTNQLTVALTSGAGNSPDTVLTMDLSQYARPDLLKLGFTASSGDSTNIHEVRNISESAIEAAKWKNLTGNSLWSGPTNWSNAKVPSSYSDIFLDSQFISTAQNIQVDTNPIIRSLYFDGSNAYTLSGNAITFNKDIAPGESVISVSATNGNAVSHTIASNLILANDVRMMNPTSAALNITGDINLGSHLLKNEGLANISGDISGTGGTLKSTGVLSLSGNNTFTGGAIISGTTDISSNNAFGTGALQLSGNLTGSANTIANVTTFKGDTTIDGVSLSNTATFSGSNTLYLNNAPSLGNVVLSNSTANTVTINNVGITTVGTISNGSATSNLVKAGSGQLTMMAANTYTGLTTINEGTVRFGVSGALAKTSSLNLNGGVLNLGGYDSQISNLAVSQSSTLDFGAAGGANDFLFRTVSTSPSGVLTLNNYNSSNIFAVLDSNRNTTGVTGLLSSVYFSGVGSGGVIENTTLIDGSTWRKIIPATNNGIVWGSSSSQTWGTSGNWVGNNTPDSNTEVAVFDGTGSQTAVKLAANTTVLGVRFEAGTNPRSYTISTDSAKVLTLDTGVSGGIAYVQQKTALRQEISVPVKISNNTVLDVTGTGNLVMSGVLTANSNTYTISKAGNGTLELKGASTGLNNSIYLTAGTTIISNSKSLGAGTNSAYATYVNNGATLNATNNISVTEPIHLEGAGYGNAGALVSSQGNNVFSGPITLDGAASINVTSNNLTISGNIASNDYGLSTTTSSGTILDFTGTGNTLGVIDKYGAGELRLGSSAVNTLNAYAGLTKVGGTLTALNGVGGDITLSGGTTAGDTTLTAGLLTLNNATLSTTTINTSSGSTINTNGGLTITGSGSSTLAGNLTGSGALTNSGNGRVYLNGNNSSYGGGINSNGVITANSSNSLGSGGVTINNGGTLELQGGMTASNQIYATGIGYGSGAINNLSGSNTISNQLILNGATTVNTTSGTLTLANVNMGSNAFTVAGVGNTIINNANASSTTIINKNGSGTLSMNQSNFGGSLNISGGTVVAGSNNLFSNTATVAFTGGTLDLNTKSLSLKSISGTNGIINMNSGTLNLSGASTFGGTFTGAGTLALGDSASLRLTNSFSDINLNLTLGNNSTLYLNGTNLTLGNLRISGTSTIDFGTAPSTITVNGVTFDSTGLKLKVSNWTDLQDYFFSLTTTGPKGSAPTNQIVFNGGNGNNTAWIPYDSHKGQFTPVPEPGVTGAVMTGMGLLAYGLVRMRKKSRNLST